MISFSATAEDNIPCLDHPTGYLPNPNAYPEFYDRNNPIHKATVIHRTVRNCSDHSVVGEPQVWPLITEDGTHYCNYICTNRYQAQCIKDGTFDTYYDEWCEDVNGERIEVEEKTTNQGPAFEDNNPLISGKK